MPRPAHTQTLQHVRPPGTAKREPQLIDVTLRASDRMLLTVEEAADRLYIGRTLMYELIREGAINTITVGRLRRIEPEAETSSSAIASPAELVACRPVDAANSGGVHSHGITGSSGRRAPSTLSGDESGEPT